MRKVSVVVMVGLFVLSMAVSCKSSKPCPAYNKAKIEKSAHS